MTGTPAVSVVVPACGRPDHLVSMIASLRRLEPIPGGLELIVVDDGSPQPLEPAVRAASGRLDVQVIRTPNRGPSAARNAGLAQARGALVAFTDDDCRPDRGWLTALAHAHAEHPRALLGGHNVTALPGNPWAEATQALEDAVYARANADPLRARFFASKNMAGPRSDLIACGGFDERFRAAEDRELCSRWLAEDRPAVYVSDAVVAHCNPRSARIFWRQHLGYGRGAYHFHRGNRRRGGRGLRPDPADYAGFVREPLFGKRRGGLSRLLVLALVVASQVAGVMGFALEAARERRRRRSGRAQAAGSAVARREGMSVPAAASPDGAGGTTTTGAPA